MPQWPAILLLATWLSTASASCPTSSPSEGGGLELEISDNVLTWAFDAADLIDETKVSGLDADSQNPNFETFQVFHDINDLAIVASRNGACFGVFQATIAMNPLDVWQLRDWSRKDVGNCQVRGGFASAYFSTYYADFISKIDECMQTTPNSELVLSGHSQGASVAVVAAIDLKRYNPTVITYGALRTLVKPCLDIQSEKHYRFVNAREGVYDKWTMMYHRIGIHVGHAILLGDHAAAAYVGMDNDADRGPNKFCIHDKENYWSGLQKLLDDNAQCFPLRISSWEEGHFCSASDECATGYSCIDSTCAKPLLSGSRCNHNHECQSGNCRREEWWSLTRCE